MGDLTRNFSRKEFKCKCGCGYDNVNPKLAETLQKIRDAFGRPIFISSGCRCCSHNESVGGVRNSQHTKCNAADIYWHGGICELYNLVYDMYERGELSDIGFIKLYKDNNFMHVDVREEKANFPRARC